MSSYTPTLTALLNARKNAQPIGRASLRALLVAEPSAPGMKTILSVVEETAASKKILTSGATPPIVVGGHGEGALKETVVAHLKTPGISILHLSCHGQQHQHPLKSGFCLRDGKLTVEELMQLNLPQPLLAYLSACESAQGDQNQPDEAVHLAAAMLFAGFRSVIATMWFVRFPNTMKAVDLPLFKDNERRRRSFHCRLLL